MWACRERVIKEPRPFRALASLLSQLAAIRLIRCDNKVSKGMANSNRGLQVTIGDVTYNLDGFDDPVEALSVISEYLRGLDAQGTGRRTAMQPDPALEAGGDPAVVIRPARRRRVESSPAGDEEAVLSQFLSRTERRAAAPEGLRRREAVVQQKAAALASRADAAVTSRKADRRAQPFHEDPRDAAQAPAEAATLRGSGPLPRRDAAFAGFVATLGAVGLPDLVDAATAWLVREGTGAVTRSRILGLAAHVMTDAPERGVALRCFEALLREGRIRRVSGDRFALGPTSRFATGIRER